MNSDELRGRLNAFVDGELEAAEAAGVQDELVADPDATAYVETQRRLKMAIAGAFGSERAPAGLEDRLRAALRAAGPMTVDGPKTIPRQNWFARPRAMAVAAAIVLVAGLGLWYGSREQGSGSWVTDTSPVAMQFAAAAEALHLACCADPEHHHATELPRTRAGAADAMRAKLQLHVSAPDLTGNGMSFAAADYCELLGHRGAHVVYACKQGKHRPISVFSVEPVAEIGSLATALHDNHSYVIVAGTKTHTVAWTDSGATYATCGQCPPDRLVTVAEQIRVAGLTPANTHILLASW
ncbi:MAG: hypothetical protein JXA69_04135 [Phycisphaerae bacterium]|nr:hypothetical protein [Phycisphaerae bacterium]